MHSSLSRLLRSAFNEAVKEDAEALGLYSEYSEGRRRFLKQVSLVAGGAVLAPGVLSLASCHKKEKTIAIIGAGIAGLNAAYQLQKKGIKSTVYEASGRIGGRMYTMHNEFGKGLTTDIGGEFVDTTHTDIITLVKELGLSLYDLREDKLARKTLYFGGKEYSEEDLKNALKPFVGRLVSDIKSLPQIISYHAAEQFRHLDELSITAYITSIGITGWLYDFLNVTLTREYGMEASIQSAVNFLIMFEPPIPFTILRTIDFNVPMPEGKKKCINEIGYGNSSKLFIGVKNKPWRTKGEQGYTFTDLSFGCGWDSSQMQSDGEGSFTVFGGGNFSDMVDGQSAETSTGKFLPDFNTIFPGMNDAYSKKTTKFCWQNNPYSKAAYSSFKTGQWSTLAGWEGVPVEEIYFAGEHVSREFQGYMNGGAQTGRVAAEMVMKSMGVSSSN